MKLSSFLHPNLIKVKHRAATHQQVINELVKEVCRDYPEDFEKKITKIIIEREKKNPTAMDSIAIPHARIENFSDLIMAVSIPSRPVEMNGQKVKIFFLILTAKTSPFYLNILSAIAKITQNRRLFEKIISSRKPEDVIKAVESAEIAVQDEFTVRDIMEKKFPQVAPDFTVRETIDILHRNKSLYALVVKDGTLLGEVTLSGILEKKIPAYVKDMINLEFMKTFEPLENLLKDEDKIKTEEVMSPCGITASPDSSVVGALLKMVRKKRQYMPVVEGGKVLGVVTFEDFVDKILRA